MIVDVAGPSDAGALAAFFAACDVRCFCRYWHFLGDKNEWLDRTANAPDENRAELEAALVEGRADGRGLVARVESGGPIVGWLKIALGASTPKIFEQRYYRSLPIFGGARDELAFVACMLVAPTHRGRGVARALVAGAAAHARRLAPTARYLVALPRVTLEPVADGELWLGPRSVFEGLGFEEVHVEPPYPVLRLPLGSATPNDP